MARVVRKKGPGAERLKVLLEGLQSDKVGKVGWFASSKYEDGTPVAYVAAIQEFGYGPIRARPFMRSSIKMYKDDWRALAESGARAILAGNVTIDQVLEGIGMQAAGDIALTISQIYSPTLSPITVELRRARRAGETINGRRVGEAAKATQSAFWSGGSGSAYKPLVDTGYMISTLTSTVEAR